ncbi:unnamed protein product (macronuclear) [Paramecium tetraurelia]|uniref:G domain-containing protein n=1 Tax=Paramecium tetraurelia TaxID=5888 RepID=A0C2L2_PARTE|nr:uncharacterized protein GSPATT00034507001 [Paramecium tetraurelia]CAK65029.1 unnamed protein product [Paramecium tetraurelia]|eukprot:XP_001432426.1 hypothetical protein (macronuclear) [Paramecium tetraurelia strain d4-2]
MEQFDLEKFYQVIKDQDTVFKKFNENVNDKLNTILLIGDTGSGKSFVFNWVCGAKFKFEDNVLKLTESQDNKFSAQSNAMQSVTYIPNFNKIDDHLIIDFPGFKDTKGKYSQLSIKLMFDEIVTKTNVKIAVVIPQSTTKLEERGTHIQELIKSAFTSKNTKFDSIGLIINSFQDDPENQTYDEKIVIKKFQEQLSLKAEQDKENAHIYQALSKQIIIIEDIYELNLSTALSDDTKNSVISKLKAISAVSYKPDYQDENQVVGSYITQELRKSITSYQRLLQKKKEDAKLNGLQQCLDNLKSEIKKMKDISKDDCNGQSEWIKNLLSKLEQSKDKKESSEKFLSIFQYFFKYKESISGYLNFELSKKQLKKSIKQYIIELEEEQKRQKEKKEEEEKKQAEINAKHDREQQNLQLKIEEQNNKFEHNLELKKLKQSEQAEQIKILNKSLDEKTNADEKIQQSKNQELQSIKDEKEKVEKAWSEMNKEQKEKEMKKKDIRSKLHEAELEQKMLIKKKEEYLETCKKSWFNPSDYGTQVKDFKDKIQAQEDIIEKSKSELIYDN